jgi:hypothetical protein
LSGGETEEEKDGEEEDDEDGDSAASPRGAAATQTPGAAVALGGRKVLFPPAFHTYVTKQCGAEFAFGFPNDVKIRRAKVGCYKIT